MDRNIEKEDEKSRKRKTLSTTESTNQLANNDTNNQQDEIPNKFRRFIEIFFILDWPSIGLILSRQ